MIPSRACQLEGDFLIRRAQAMIAMEMISPPSGENSVMQVNMGEGKSSVIVPIAAVALANGHQLVRIIIPKPLTTQMMDLLADRLGGLANRLVYQLPFSRSSYFRPLDPEAQHCEMSRCMEQRGIILAQPEHVLSLKLTSVERQLSKCKISGPPSPKIHNLINSDSMASSLKFVSVTTICLPHLI